MTAVRPPGAGTGTDRTPVSGTRPPARVDDRVTGWLDVCPVDRLLPGRGAAALVGDVQVALFRLDGDIVHALGNLDPFTGAAVISRGIVGDRDGTATVASPVHKQAFGLVDGRCLDDAAVGLPVYVVRVREGWLQVGLR